MNIEEFQKLKSERDSLKQQLADANQYLQMFRCVEECKTCLQTYSPSLIESGVCIFCIATKRKQQLSKWQEVAGTALHRISRFGQMRGEGWMEMENRKFIESPEAQLAQEAITKLAALKEEGK